MSKLILFNSLTNKHEVFVPSNHKDVKIYCCGPTVYDVPHLGHVRTNIFFDSLCRIMRYCMNYKVRSVMNITDNDDKIIEKGGLETALFYERIYFETMDLLNIEKPDFTPRASDYVKESQILMEKCDKKGFVTVDDRFAAHAYFYKYGFAFPYSQNRGIPEEGFAIWKPTTWKDAKGTLQSGKPGWHTECAAMNAYFFGDTIDLHLGGIDLQFPHHENEIALGRVLFDKENWVRYVIHTGHLEIEGHKMSKSTKNFITVQDMLDQNISPLAIRYLFLKHKYNKTMSFNMEEMIKAEKSYFKFISNLKILKEFLQNGEHVPHKPDWTQFNLFKFQLEDYLMDNLNTSKALQHLEDYVKVVLLEIKNKPWLQYCLNYVIEVTDKWFGLIMKETENRSEYLVSKLEKFRCEVRKETLSLLTLCDNVRGDLKKNGYKIEDKNFD